MNLAITGIDMRAGERRMPQRIAAGVAVSLAVHVLVLSSWRGGHRAPDVPPERPRPLAVRVQPPPPPLRVETPPPSPPPAAEAPARAPTPRKPRKVIAVPPAPAAAPAPDPFVVEQVPEPPPMDTSRETPRFDLDAARKAARSLANIRDPAREGTAVAQFPEKPLETETRAARAIAGAKRRHCKDGVPGGLLAPLLMLADKKDSGCKW